MEAFRCENREYAVRYKYYGREVVKSHVWVEPVTEPHKKIGEIVKVTVGGSQRDAVIVGIGGTF